MESSALSASFASSTLMGTFFVNVARFDEFARLTGGVPVLIFRNARLL
jgi:hypothetical protein